MNQISIEKKSSVLNNVNNIKQKLEKNGLWFDYLEEDKYET